MIAMISPSLSGCEHTLNTLRYADRVKELGPGGPSDSKPSDGNMAAPAAGLSPQKSDLVLLRDANYEELPEDLLELHAVVTHMQEEEEGVIDGHNNLFEQNVRWNDMDRKLLKMTESVDYDIEAYAQQLETLLSEKISALSALKEKVVNLRREIKQEEYLSQNMHSSKGQ